MATHLLAAVLCLSLGGGHMGMFRRPAFAEPLPLGWELLGRKPGVEERIYDDITAASKACDAAGVPRPYWGGQNPSMGRAQFFRACFDPKANVIHASSAKALRSEKDAAELIEHERGHPWGLSHDPKTGKWLGPDGKPAQPLTPERAGIMRAIAEMEHKRQGMFAQRK